MIIKVSHFRAASSCVPFTKSSHHSKNQFTLKQMIYIKLSCEPEIPEKGFKRKSNTAKTVTPSRKTASDVSPMLKAVTPWAIFTRDALCALDALARRLFP